MRMLLYSSFWIVISLCFPSLSLSQKDVLVPYRLDDKFGLSDLKGNVKLKPQYDLVEPIGGGYFKYSNSQMRTDTIRNYNGNIKVSERLETTHGLLKGKKVIIDKSEHRHFTLVDNALIVGSQESYVSANSNFYTLNGERLLNENAEKFRILATNGYEPLNKADAHFITIFVEHYDRKKSVLIFDVINQKMIEPLLNRVNELTLDRNESSESHLVFSYYDDNYQNFKERIYYNDSLKRHVKETYTPRSRYNYGYGGSYDSDEDGLLSPGSYGVMEAEPRGAVSGGSGTGGGTGGSRDNLLNSTPQVPVRKKIYSFQKVNDTLVKYGEASITMPQGQKIIFGDRYSSTQRQPLIYTDGRKYGLLHSDSLRTEMDYDSLRYIKHNSSFLYLAGKRNKDNKDWSIGILNAQGEVIIPLTYSNVTPGILELDSDKDDRENKYAFSLKQAYTYSKDANQPLSMYGSSFTVTHNGKMGLVDFSNKILLPIEYDSLWKNGLSFMTTLRSDDDFYVYKQNGKYGLFRLNYKTEAEIETKAVFPMIPVCRYKNYAGIEGFDLVQLANERSLYFCYAGNDGTIYYKKKQGSVHNIPKQ